MDLDTYILTAREQRKNQLQLRNAQLLAIRWVYLLIIVFFGIVVPVIVQEDHRLFTQHTAILSGFILVNSGIWLYVKYRPQREIEPYQAIAFFQIVIDIAIAMYATYSPSAAWPHTPILYTFPIITAGFLFRRSVVFLSAGLASIAYAATLAMVHIRDSSFIILDSFLAETLLFAMLFSLASILVSYLSGYSARRARAESYDELLAMLTHQLRHPASAIAAIIDVIESGKGVEKLSKKQLESIELIKKENFRSLSLISNLLEAARIDSRSEESIKFRTVNLSQLITEAAASCATTLKRQDDLSFDMPEGTVSLRGHNQQLRMALDNIIHNAFLYSDNGSKVSVTLKTTPDSLRISVADRGRGMTKQQQKQLSDRFVDMANRRKPSHPPSAGLGIFVSKRIIERHHGTLTIESKHRRGTTVNITFKRTQEK